MEQDKKDAEEAKKKAKQKTLLGFLQGGAGTNNDEEGSVEFSLAGLFRCMLCTHKKDGEEKIQLMHIADSLDKLSKKLETIERFVKIAHNIINPIKNEAQNKYSRRMTKNIWFLADCLGYGFANRGCCLL